MRKILLFLLLSTGFINPVVALNCYGDDWSDCIQRYEYPSGDVYFGQWKNNQAHGRGSYRWKSGEAYFGDFENNQFNGRGQYQASKTNYINGIWENGKILYEHTITVTGFMQATDRCYRNKYELDKDNELLRETYCGPKEDEPFTQNQLKLIASVKEPEIKECFGLYSGIYKGGPDPKLLNNCKASWKFKLDDANWPGATYTGEWKNGKPDGNGRLTYGPESQSKGDEYVGNFAGNSFSGYGVMTSAKGDIYKGEWLNGEPNGQGKMTLADGSVWVGEFGDGKLQGPGLATSVDGKKMDGIFDNGQLINGTASFPSGAIYKGKFINNVFIEGKATFTNSGNTKEGKFHKDGYLIEGKVISADSGNIYEGKFHKDDYLIKGKVIFAESGNIYEGSFDKDSDLIEGKVIFADSGTIYEGIWSKDRRLIEGKITFKDGNSYEGVFNKDGDLIKGVIVSSDGSVSEIGREPTKPEIQIADNITTDDEIIPAASGSGFAVTSDGYVVTNYHVIEGCSAVEVYEDNQPISAVVINFDLNNDIALLKADFKPNHYFPLRSKNPSLMMDIYAAGYPFGYDISTPVKVTQGIVSSLSGVGNNYSNIQIDAAIQPGNSGGPIIDKKGNVVAVAVATLDLEEVFNTYGVVPEGINFGIKSNVVINFLESNNVKTSEPNTRNVSTESLGRMISDGTYYISCLMTMAQINNLRERKAMFSNLN